MPQITQKEAGEQLLGALAKQNWALGASLAPMVTLAAASRALDALLAETGRLGAESKAGAASWIEPDPEATRAKAQAAAAEKTARKGQKAPAQESADGAPGAPASKTLRQKPADPRQGAFDFGGDPAAAGASTDGAAVAKASARPPRPPVGETPEGMRLTAQGKRLRELARFAAALIARLGDGAATRDAIAFVFGCPLGKRTINHLPIPESGVLVAAWCALDGGMIRPARGNLRDVDWRGVRDEVAELAIRVFGEKHEFHSNDGVWAAKNLIERGLPKAAVEALRQDGARRGIAAPIARRNYLDEAWALSVYAAQTKRTISEAQARESLLEAKALGFPIGIDAIVSMAKGWQDAHKGEPKVSVAERRAVARDLDWIIQAGALTQEALREALGSAVKNTLDDARKRALCELLADRGATPDQEAWDAAGSYSPECFKFFREKGFDWPMPGWTLAAAAGSQHALAAQNVKQMLPAQEWSEHERAVAIGKALKGNNGRAQKIEAILALGPLGPDALSVALEAAAALSPYQTRNGDRHCSPREWIALGARPAGCQSDGEPLKQALMAKNWPSAEEIATAGGWGPEAESWLLAERKRDVKELAPWKAEALAMREAKALGRLSASVSKKADEQRRREARAEAKAKKSAPTLSEPAPVEAAPTASAGLKRRRL
jgi:hypothetical protein